MRASSEGDCVVPGQSALQVIPLPASSSATARVSPISAVFVVT